MSTFSRLQAQRWWHAGREGRRGRVPSLLGAPCQRSTGTLRASVPVPDLRCTRDGCCSVRILQTGHQPGCQCVQGDLRPPHLQTCSTTDMRQELLWWLLWWPSSRPIRHKCCSCPVGPCASGRMHLSKQTNKAASCQGYTSQGETHLTACTASAAIQTSHAAEP